ncbi:MAG: hypothetical protein K2X66_14420 [Cyanobacteria bacterium]|nr:hypothetical protein [Cyanobacteriota bacterium]
MVMLNQVNFQRTVCVKGFFRVPSLRFSDTLVFKNIPSNELVNFTNKPLWYMGHTSVAKKGDQLYFIMDASLASSANAVFDNLQVSLNWFGRKCQMLSEGTMKKMEEALLDYFLKVLRIQSLPSEALKLPKPSPMEPSFTSKAQLAMHQVSHRLHELTLFN